MEQDIFASACIYQREDSGNMYTATKPKEWKHNSMEQGRQLHLHAYS